jgi:predicted nucleic acid-binding protein
MRRWVVDASPIILLATIGYADLLALTADSLLIPEAVSNEVRDAEKDDPARTWLEEHSRWVESTSPVVSEVAAWDLGQGESNVLSYALQSAGWTVVVDDAAARRCAQAFDIPVVGTLGILVLAKKQGDLDMVRPVIQSLVRSGMHVDEAVIRQVLRMADEA